MKDDVRLREVVSASDRSKLAKLSFEIFECQTTRDAILHHSDGSVFLFVEALDQVVGFVGAEMRVVDRGIRLGWSGVVPALRKRGLFRAALDLLEERLSRDFPSAEYMIENGPIEVREVFEALGFEFLGVKDGVAKLVRPIRLRRSNASGIER